MSCCLFFFFNDTATTEIYTLSLHDALPIFNPADYRVEFYGDTLFALQRLATREGQAVRSFRAASLKGWDYALQHPDEIAQRLVAELPRPPGIADPAGFARYQAELARRPPRHPQVEL